MKDFQEFGLRPELLKAIADLGYTTPTPIQAQTIEKLINSDNDLVALAQTGTGKTAAFSLPILERIDTSNPTVQALILAPTRELCVQITNDIEKFSKYMPKLKSLAVYGGTNIAPQIAALKDKVHIVIGTPGRTLDIINRKRLDISNIHFLVLDEADEMLSMGFKDELDAILETAPVTKQVLLFSATMPSEIRRIAKEYMRNAQEVSVSKVNLSTETVQHVYYVAHAKDRYLALKRIVDVHPNIYGIIFCRTKAETQDVADKLGHDGYNSDALHGDLSQAQRDYVMNRFRKRQLQILVATDVAARGLDVTDLTHVINFNLPDDPEVYIHRSGRTGRAGKTGESCSIIHSKEMGKIRLLERKIGRPMALGKIPTGKEICENQLFSLIDKIKSIELSDSQINQFMPAILSRIEDIEHSELIKRFVSVEFNRFLEYYKDATDINVIEHSRDKSGSKFVKFSINHGRISNLTPKMLINLINEHLPDKSIEIGRIDIQKTFTFFDIDSKYQNEFIEAFERTPYQGLKVQLEGKSESASVERSYGGGGGRSRSHSSRDEGRSDRSSSYRGDKPSSGSGSRNDRYGGGEKKVYVKGAVKNATTSGKRDYSSLERLTNKKKK